MTTLIRPGVPVGGFKTVGQIHATNNLAFRRDQNAMAVAVELLSTHTSGAPVLDERGEFIGFISEFGVGKGDRLLFRMFQLLLRTCVTRQRPFETADWQATIEATLDLSSTFRRRRRPRKQLEK